jgi:hypothetical protein
VEAAACPNEALRYFMLHHRLIPERSVRAEPDNSAAPLRASAAPILFRCGTCCATRMAASPASQQGERPHRKR